MTKITTITNFKGGAGKTTTARNVAEGLAMRGLRVLFIDFDESGNGTESFGIMPDKHAYNAMTGERFEPSVTGVGNLDLLPGNARLRTVQELHKLDGVDLPAAADILRSLGCDYDHVVIDTPPNGYMQSLAIFAADHVIITTQVNMFSIRGVASVMTMIDEGVQRYGIDRPEVTILPVMVTRTREAFENYAELSAAFPRLMAEQPIPFRTEVAEAESRMVSVFEHKPKGDAAMAYCSLIDTLDSSSPVLFDVMGYTTWDDFCSTSIAAAIAKRNEEKYNG